MVRDIVNRYEHQYEHQMALLKYSDRHTNHKNVFDILAQNSVTAKRRLLTYFLSFIDDKVHNNVLLKGDSEGKSPLWRLFVSRYNDTSSIDMLHKFSEDRYAEVLLTKDNAHKTMLEQSSAGVIAKMIKYLDEAQLIQLFCDNTKNTQCFAMLLTQFQEKSMVSDLVEKALLTGRRGSDGASFLMVCLVAHVVKGFWWFSLTLTK